MASVAVLPPTPIVFNDADAWTRSVLDRLVPKDDDASVPKDDDASVSENADASLIIDFGEGTVDSADPSNAPADSDATLEADLAAKFIDLGVDEEPGSEKTEEPAADDEGGEASELSDNQLETLLGLTQITDPEKFSSVATRASSNPLHIFLRVQPFNQTIINQRRHALYRIPGNEYLYATATTYMVAVENVPLMSWSNSLSQPQQYTHQYTVGFSTSTSKELSVDISLAPSFNGVSIGGVSIGKKIIQNYETSSSATVTTTVNVGPHEVVYFYQRRYHLTTMVYFTLDAWNRLWLAGPRRNLPIATTVQYATINSVIRTRDYVTTTRPLKGVGRTQFMSQQRQPYYGTLVRRFENLTGRAQHTLRRYGIDGSQQRR